MLQERPPGEHDTGFVAATEPGTLPASQHDTSNPAIADHGATTGIGTIGQGTIGKPCSDRRGRFICVFHSPGTN
jgi:hypothetical protein